MPTEQQMHGLPLDQLLTSVWYDGFTSGAATGCGLFLPGAAADAKADEIVAAPSLRKQVHRDVRERLQAVAAGQRSMDGPFLDDLMVTVWYDGFACGTSTSCRLFLPAAAAAEKADEIARQAAAAPILRKQVRREVRERLQMTMAEVEASGHKYTVITPDRAAAPSQAPTVVQTTDE